MATAISFDIESQTGAIIFTNSPPVRFRDQKVFYQEIMKRLLKEAKFRVHISQESPPLKSGKIR